MITLEDRVTMEEAFDQVYQEFVDEMRPVSFAVACEVINDLVMGDVRRVSPKREAAILNYQAMEGWSGVLRTLSQIQEEKER